MNSFSAMIAALVLLLPESTTGRAHSQAMEPGFAPDAGEASAALGVDLSNRNPWRTFLNAHRSAEQGQVRIEQRVILRISPRPRASREDLLAVLPRGEPSAHIEERKIGSCVPIRGIAGVGTAPDDRLILFMRDQRIVSASLEKSCRARDFYSGFYVQRSDDGRICVKRDKIQSRAGVKCELQQLRQLVAVAD